MLSRRPVRALILAILPTTALFVGPPTSQAAADSSRTLLSRFSTLPFASASQPSLLNDLLAARLPDLPPVSGADYEVIAFNVTCDGRSCPTQARNSDYSAFSHIQVGIIQAVKAGTQSIGIPDAALVECISLTRTQLNPTRFARITSIGLAGAAGSDLYAFGHLSGTAGATGTKDSTHARGFAAFRNSATPEGASKDFSSFQVTGLNFTDNTVQRSVSTAGFTVTTTGSVVHETDDQTASPIGPTTITLGNNACQAGQSNGSLAALNIG